MNSPSLSPIKVKENFLSSPLWSPINTYPIIRLPNGDIKVQWTVSASKKWLNKSVVYQIKNLKNLKRYIGQTTNLFKRISSHISHSKRAPDAPLFIEMQQQPEQFVIGAVATDTPDELESQLIKQKNTMANGYNRRSGGGGGKARNEPPVSQQTMQRTFHNLIASYRSPMKFPLSNSVGTVIHSAPQPTQQQQKVVYLIERKTSKGKWVYVGSTGRKFSQRLREHLFHANHPKLLRSKHSPIYRIMNRYANQCTVSVINNDLFPSGLSLSTKEQLIIELYQTRGYTLYNKNNAGGGGAPKK